MHVVITTESWVRFLNLVEAWRNQGEWGFEKALRNFAESEGWDWMPLDDKRRFHRWATVILRRGSRFAFVRERRAQLDNNGFAWWVYRSGDVRRCPPEHAALDGIVLPPHHDFWARYMPPNSFDCGCCVHGTHLPGGTRRLGGDPDKPLPDWWRAGRGIEGGFEGREMPDLFKVIELLDSGFFD